MGDNFFMDFSFFAHRFFVKNLWKFILQMGNPLGVYETNYKVKKVQNLSLGKIWPPSDLLFLEWSYCTKLNNFWIRNFLTSVSALLTQRLTLQALPKFFLTDTVTHTHFAFLILDWSLAQKVTKWLLCDKMRAKLSLFMLHSKIA